MIDTRVVRIPRAGGPEVLEIAAGQCRPPGPHEIRVEVTAVGLNRADVLQRKGLYPAPAGAPGDVPGLEYAGAVGAVGPEVSSFRVGDRVMGIVAGGAMATHLVVHEREAMRVPNNLLLEDAAAIPEVFMTAWDAVFEQAHLRLGETLLVHAIGSGVGTAALQLGLVTGARVVGTSRSPEKLERCKDLGLEHAIRVEADGRFAGQVLADVILDTVGAGYFGENIRALAPKGRLVVIGLLSGAKGEVPLGTLLAKRLTVIGSVLRSRPAEEKFALAQSFSREVLPLFESRRIAPVIEAKLPMADIAEAHRLMESDKTFGKIVLLW